MDKERRSNKERDKEHLEVRRKEGKQESPTVEESHFLEGEKEKKKKGKKRMSDSQSQISISLRLKKNISTIVFIETVRQT